MTDDPAADRYDLADALDALAEDLRAADSIADDTPTLAELFHEARTSRRKPRGGSYTALLDYDDTGGWTCRSVAFLQTGTHYRDTGADATVSHKPWPFLSVDEFAEHIAEKLERDARATRQNAAEIEADR